MRNKLKTKNKLNDTFIFHQGKEREKRDEKKKVHQSLTTLSLCTHAALIEK
jgi:hypothetical protein